jgi:antitoxin PrlF
MAIAHSRLTAQGQVSVPASVRRRLGVGPGAVLEWEETAEGIVVRRSGKFTFEDMNRALFPAGAPPRKSLSDLKDGVRKKVRARHAVR